MKCKACGGTGIILVPDDPSPPGVALSPGTMDVEDECPDCDGTGKIPDRWTDQQLDETEDWFDRAVERVKSWLIETVKGFECGLCLDQVNMPSKEFWRQHIKDKHPLAVSVTRAINMGTQTVKQLKFERRRKEVIN